MSAPQRVKLEEKKAGVLYDGKGAGTKDTKLKVQAEGPLFVSVQDDVDEDNGWLVDGEKFEFTPTAEHQVLYGWSAKALEVQTWVMGPGS